MEHRKRSAGCITKKTGDSYAVWFPPSQSFVLLKSPAYEAFTGIEKGESDEEILSSIAEQTGAGESEIRSFIKELRAGFEALMDPSNLPYISPQVSDKFNHCIFSHFAVRYYRINGISFRLAFGSDELFQQFDPILAHLHIDSIEDTDFSLDLFFQDGLYLFRIYGIVIEAFLPKHLNYLKGAVFKKIAGLIYSIPEENWMASFHASSISDGKSAILFSAKPGSGKSTIAALLQTHGYLMLSDDFITLDTIKEHVWHLPLALSVKKGSLKILSKDYPQLNTSSAQKTLSGKHVHYLEPFKNREIHDSSFPVKAIVFICYSPETPILIEELSPEDALLSLLEETWVNPVAENVQQFLNWFEDKKCIRISYSDYKLVLEELEGIFKS
jgi:hypothetical protein